MKESLKHVEVFPIKAAVLYKAWLNSRSHAKMTGGGAQCSNLMGEPFSAWDGYITGNNVILEEGVKIVQTWRTLEFGADDDDSELTLLFKDTKEGCELTLIHENIPEGQTQYDQGWVDNYFIPMRAYFGEGE
jgi:activator of HSP90 ATPase